MGINTESEQRQSSALPHADAEPKLHPPSWADRPSTSRRERAWTLFDGAICFVAVYVATEQLDFYNTPVFLVAALAFAVAAGLGHVLAGAAIGPYDLGDDRRASHHGTESTARGGVGSTSRLGRARETTDLSGTILITVSGLLLWQIFAASLNVPGSAPGAPRVPVVVGALALAGVITTLFLVRGRRGRSAVTPRADAGLAPSGVGAGPPLVPRTSLLVGLLTAALVIASAAAGGTMRPAPVAVTQPGLISQGNTPTTLAPLGISPGPNAPTSSAMVNPRIYGTGIAGDTKANLPVGPDGRRVAIRFKATTTSQLKSVRFVQRGGPRYSAGDGGTLDISVQPDTGTGNPSGTRLAQQSYSPGNPDGTWETYHAVSFPAPPTLSAGTIYYIVFENPSASNFISVNSILVYDGPFSPRQPTFADSEYAVLYTSGAWNGADGHFTPVVDLAYANGTHDGQAYYELMIDHYGTISGPRSMVREHFTVSGGDRTVHDVSVRVRRTGGTAPLTLTLETWAGTAVESVNVPAASVPVSAPGGDNGGAVWVTATFSSPHVLSDKGGYNLRLSTTADTTYTTFPIRSGRNKGFSSFSFQGGTGQFTTDGSTWSDLYRESQQDLQFYFTLSDR